MQQFGWTNEHSEALRQYLREGMSYLESSKALNAKFKTAYSRSAIIGRAKRMGLSTAEQRDDPPSGSPARCSRELIPLREARERHVPDFVPRIPLFQAYELPKLRCVESVRAILRTSIWRPAIADIRMAATRREKIRRGRCWWSRGQWKQRAAVT